MSSTFIFPPLVSAHLNDLRVQNAVRDLTKPTMAKGFDAAFGWEEFPRYVDTWLAAQQTVAEWCKAQFALWDEIWGFALDGAPSYTRRFQTDDDFDVGGIHECWQEGWVSRHVQLGNSAFSLTLYLDTDEASISIEFAEKISRSRKNALGLAGWTVDAEDLPYDIVSPPVDITKNKDGSAQIELDALRQHATSGISALNSVYNFL